MEYARDVIVSVSAVAVAVFAWLGLQTWRKELIGRARFETARNMAHMGFLLRSSFAHVRYNPTYTYEWADRVPREDETDAESEVLNEQHARTKRGNLLVDSLNKIFEVQWEAEILFDETSAQSVRDAVESYSKSYAELSTAVAEYFDARLKEAKSGKLLKDQDWLKELRHVIYQIPDDEFAQKVSEATEKLSSAAKQYVR